METKYWLVKSEPHVFSLSDLLLRPGQRESWDGVRNYQARNYMRDEMKLGHLVLFYHSSCENPGVYGVAQVVRESYPDFTSWDELSPYYDPRSTENSPRWFMVDLGFVEEFSRPVLLPQLRLIPQLQQLKIIQRGSRLSVGPVSESEFKIIRSKGTALGG